MRSEIKNKYLIFPVNTLAANKVLSFNLNGEAAYKLNIKLDNHSPDFYAYVDVSRFIGQTLDILVSPEMKLDFRAADEIDIDNLYHEPLRPQIHFSTKSGWINDPNGLIYLDGTYHLFYQYNPTDIQWENMPWGPAESKNLIQWEEKSIALFPDERGTMFSGCAVLDEKNLLGKNEGDKKATVFFYTTTTPFCQNISYSTDNFKTVHSYEGNPIIPYIMARNRDPKVVFCDELDCYIMILFLDGDLYSIFRSDDLANWSEIQQLHLPDSRECPDIFPIYDKEGTRKWVIIGANDKYMVGGFVNGVFVAEQPVLALHYGNCGYAGQNFSNLPNGRIVRIVWDKWTLPTHYFCGQMGIPVELSLDKHDGTYYLQASPVEEIKNLYKDTKAYSNVSLSPDTSFSETLECTAHLVKIKKTNLDGGKMTVSIFGRDIDFDFSNNKITVGGKTAPISITHGKTDITIIVDRLSMETFSDGGKISATFIDEDTVSDYNVPRLTIKADSPIMLDAIEINSLESIWE